MQNRTGRTGQANQDRIYIYIPERDRQNRTGRQDRQNWTDKTGQALQVRHRTSRKGQAERTIKTGQAKQDRQNRP
jgi:hypothetical protein